MSVRLCIGTFNKEKYDTGGVLTKSSNRVCGNIGSPEYIGSPFNNVPNFIKE